jgi:hypothetical protein
MPPDEVIAEARKHGQAPPWFWPSGFLLIAAFSACVINGWFTLLAPEWRFANSATQSNGDFFNIASPSAATWKPSASEYCSDVGELNNDPPGLGQHTPLEATLIANSAPTATAHAVAVRLFDALRVQNATQADINAVNSAYMCPLTSTNN